MCLLCTQHSAESRYRITNGRRYTVKRLFCVIAGVIRLAGALTLALYCVAVMIGYNEHGLAPWELY